MVAVKTVAVKAAGVVAVVVASCSCREHGIGSGASGDICKSTHVGVRVLIRSCTGNVRVQVQVDCVCMNACLDSAQARSFLLPNISHVCVCLRARASIMLPALRLMIIDRKFVCLCVCARARARLFSC